MKLAAAAFTALCSGGCASTMSTFTPTPFQTKASPAASKPLTARQAESSKARIAAACRTAKTPLDDNALAIAASYAHDNGGIPMMGNPRDKAFADICRSFADHANRIAGLKAPAPRGADISTGTVPSAAAGLERDPD